MLLSPRHCLVHLAVVLALLLVCRQSGAQDTASLLTSGKAKPDWSFNNGSEFPGAKGSLSVETEAGRDGRACLKLVGDFTAGGGYVQAGRKIDSVDIRELTFWVRDPDANQLSLRLNDASGQTHQIVLKLEPGPDWQQVVLPLERFFARRGEADAVTTIKKYESWGGAKDGMWHGPAKAIYFLRGNPGDHKVHTLWLSDIAILPRPTELPGAEAKSSIALDELVDGAHDWRFSLGQEFPGATGSLTVVKDQPAAGKTCLKLAGDFTAGGAYVAAVKNLQDLDVKDVTAIRLRVKSNNAASIGIQLVDGSGQTHQRSRTAIKPDGEWHDLVLAPSQIAGGEHWGGAKDGKWHGPLKQLAISLSHKSDETAKQPVLYLADVCAEALVRAVVKPPAFKSSFDEAAQAFSGWTISGDCAIDTRAAFKGNASLLLSRSFDSIALPCSVASPTFPVTAGQWQLNLACKSDLHSPDNSYSAVVQLECFGEDGKVVDRFPIADVFGKHDWQSLNKQVELPKGVATARFQAQLNKTYGRFWLDDLTAAYLAPAPQRDDGISRMLFSTAQLGNLLFPTDSRIVRVTVDARKPLRDGQHTISYNVRDYWGSEQMAPSSVTLGAAEKKQDRFVYETTIDLSAAPLEIGRYYEVHAAIARDGDEPFRNYTSLAILPEAETKRYKPEEVPFTSRNWDNRISEYIRLTDRLGVRVCGVWGGWSAQPPYKPEAPGLDLVQQLGMGWLTGTPIHSIELGEKKYDETSLREGVRHLIDQYGKVRPMFINLGNEPHGAGPRVLANVEAYRVVYEEVKKIDPSIPVIATSVEPNEEYFRAGYGKWCDAYDFHIYEDSENVRKTIGQYQALAQKYEQVKPIWSTELGLNSQGMTRHAVAVEVSKKFATFFAAGGSNVSWFGLLYPDADAKSHGSSGNSHNVFDCRYNRYCPRLDAIAYYNAVNAISIKKFADEKHYPDGIAAFLFRDRDDRCLQVLWKDKGRQDVSLLLPGVNNVQIIRVDGRRRALNAGGDGITLSISEDPLLLLYDGGAKTLPAALGAAAAALDSPPQTISRGGTTMLSLAISSGSAGDVELVAPPFWTVTKSQSAPDQTGRPSVHFSLTPPKASSVREADLIFTLNHATGQRRGELYYRCPIGE